MSEVADQTAKPADSRDWRALVWWGAGLALLALVALFCRFLLAPWLEVRAVVWARSTPDEVIKKLGGPDKAVPKLFLYARLPRRLAPEKETTLRLLGRCRDKAVPVLIVLLRARDSDIRARVALVLGNIADARAVEPLIAALKDPDPDVRASAAGALGEIKDARATEPLQALLQHEDEDVRRIAREALGKLAAPAQEPAPAPRK